MFEKFTEKARRVIFFARYEASNFGSTSIGVEHLLLGILRESKWPQHFLGVGKAQLFEKRLREEAPVRERIPTNVDLPFSADAREALNSCAEEAQRSGHIRIAPEHILLGLLRQESTIAQEIMKETGVTLDAVRSDIAQWLQGRGSLPDAGPDMRFGSTYGRTGMPAPNEDFTRAISDAMEEARRLSSTTVRSEHLLLGLALSENSLAARILREAGLDHATICSKLDKK